jgi:hypothetical protein
MTLLVMHEANGVTCDGLASGTPPLRSKLQITKSERWSTKIPVHTENQRFCAGR